MRFRPSLALKLSLAFLAVVIVAVGLAAYLIHLSTSQEFLSYVGMSQMMGQTRGPGMMGQMGGPD
ncbi:MAG: hypothetical protein Q8O76_13335, partial [Chloroflexota bacterium]|nr:hypothetical protein [Chloroflexota bacterium]